MGSVAKRTSDGVSRLTSPQPACRYDLDIDMSSRSTQARVVRLVGRRKRVLELGCATGYMSRVLYERGCHVVGVDLDAAAAERAAEFCERIIVGDLDRINIHRELGEARFDVVVAADVLEHLKDPVRVLRLIRPHLERGGRVVSSIPNVAHGSVRLALLTGAFPYAEVGLLDRTHLRFFTAASMDQLFADAGFRITRTYRQQRAIDRSEVLAESDKVPDEAFKAIASDPEALTYQFIVTAEPAAGDDQDGIGDDLDENGDPPDVVQMRRTMEELSTARATLEHDLAVANRRFRTLKAQRERTIADLAELRRDMKSSELRTRQRSHDLVEELTLARNEIDRLGVALEERERQLERRLTVLWELGEEQERLRGRVADLEQERDLAVEERSDARRELAIARTEREAVARLAVGMRDNQTLIDEYEQDRTELRRRVNALTRREQHLRELLLDAHLQMVHRDEEFQVMLTEVLGRVGRTRQGSVAGPDEPQPGSGEQLGYQLLIRKIRDVAEDCIPADATVIVVSKGDPELLQLGGRSAWHFPQDDDGVYAGFHPASSQEAIDNLERLRATGGTFLLIPATSMWWLEHYAEFRHHLQSSYRMVASVGGVCQIIDLRDAAHPGSSGRAQTRTELNGQAAAGRKVTMVGRALRSRRGSRSQR